MILPGLVSIAFYRKRPSALQIGLGIVFTVVVSGLIGYVQDLGTPRVWENVVFAIIGGVILYVAILAYLLYWYFPKHEKIGESRNLSSSDPPG